MSEEQEVPKKITLTVPSLFIKNASSSGSNQSGSASPGNGERPKPTGRPMPASMKKKLEEANSTNVSSSDSSDTLSTSASQHADGSPKKAGRPMPASARRKLEKAAKASEDSNEDRVSESGSSTVGLTTSNRPMPASARLKLMKEEESSRENKTDDAEPEKNSTETDQPAKQVARKPMPASAKRKVEEFTKTTDITEESESMSDDLPVKIEKTRDKPMPASARKLLEAKSMTKSEETVECVTDDSQDNDPKNVKVAAKPMPASARRKLEEASSTVVSEAGQESNSSSSSDHDEKPGIKGELNDLTMSIGSVVPEDKGQKQESGTGSGEDIEAKETKKINISLGGITFPTFKKPMPAFAKRKVEENLIKVETTSDTSSSVERSASEKASSGDDGIESIDNTLRSTRRGRSSGHELLSLEDEKFACDVCGVVYYKADSLRRHKQTHLVSKQEGDSVPKPKREGKKKPESKSKYRGMQACPYCNKAFSNWKKISKHSSHCKSRPSRRLDKKSSSAENVEKMQEKAGVSESSEDHPYPIPISNHELSDDSAPSPISVDSKSSKTSVVEKSKPMPRSVKAKLEGETEDSPNEKKSDFKPKEEPSKGVQSFKRKIADVLSTLGNRRHTNTTHVTDEVEDEGPPRKKTILSSKTENASESIRGHPMPASVKKKLQSRDSKDQGKQHSTSALAASEPSTSKTEEVEQDLDDLECQVCHKVFTQICNRQRHERRVHSITNPRFAKGYKPSPKIQSAKKEEMPKADKASKLNVDSLPRSGKCPICLEFKVKLKEHVRNVHKLRVSQSSAGPPPGTRHAVSYKIYKSAANKAKQKLSVASNSFKKPIISLEKLIPMAKVQEKNDTVKTERKVLATTATSELRCACCDKIFEVQCDFYEHMTMEHPKAKRLVTCKICEHRFSHEEDFFLHVQFKHRDIVATMKPKGGKSSSAKKMDGSNSTQERTEQTVSIRSARKSIPSSKNSIQESVKTVPLSIRISADDVRRAKAAMQRESSQQANTFQQKFPSTSNRRSTRQNSEIKDNSPEPENMQESYFDDSDHHFDDSEQMEVEESEIAITSTFSQKVASPEKKKMASDSNDLDPMHCSTCSEVFYSYEALRKHELYFHNVKTTKMCPICGVYPTRLSRHLLAHENKTVRCSCVPCRLSFPDFSQLLKHNLEKHPGVNGGALTAPNKPRDQPQTNNGKVDQSNNESDPYRCLICEKEFPGAVNARRHIRRCHSEQDADASTLVQKVGEPETDKEVEEILQDTSKKLQDSDWDADDDEIVAPKPASTDNNLRRSSRPMPASARAKLNKEQEDKSTIVEVSEDSNASSQSVPKKISRPLPASVRAKLEAEKNAREARNLGTETKESPTPNVKPSRPMPASVRAKLMAQSDSENSRDSFSSSGNNKPSRPMPASVRAKLGMLNATKSVMKIATLSSTNTKAKAASDEEDPPPILTPEVIIDQSSGGQKENTTEQEVIDLGDDDDYDDPVDDSVPEPEPMPPSVPTFSIADEIAEHNRAVEISMGGSHSRDSSFNFTYMFQCKLCAKKFETAEITRRHIKKAHSEYGPDLAENLIGQLNEEYADTPRRRKPTIRYNEDEEDEEEEVIITRGTSRRPRQAPVMDSGWNTPYSDNNTEISRPTARVSVSTDSGIYACRWCNQRKDSAANVKRHIAKAHPQLYEQRDQGVIVLESDQEYVDLPPPPVPPIVRPVTPKAGNPIYVCKICSKCMTVRSSLYMHIIRFHTEVEKGTAPQYIQELNGSGNDTTASYNDTGNETSYSTAANVDPDTSFYCSICSYQTTDERDYVRHYKGHTGVSPYQCQYCSATFNRQQDLNAHVTREHTGAEFLSNDETEISMEEVVASNEISIGTSSKIHIETPSAQVSDRRQSSESNGSSAKRYTPGPASRKTAAARKSVPETVEPMETETENSPPNSPTNSVDDNAEESDTVAQNKQRDSTIFSYQGDLSSLFPTLGGGAAPGGIDALDDIDGGMSLD